MRAREFIINVPITIKINGDDDPEIGAGQEDEPSSKLDPNPIMIPPLQQDLELRKSAAGKNSPIIQKLTQDETEEPEQEPIYKIPRR